MSITATEDMSSFYYDLIIKMKSAIRHNNGDFKVVWITNRQTYYNITTCTDSQGRFIYTTPVCLREGKPSLSLMGDELIVVDAPHEGDKFLIYGIKGNLE